MSNPNKTCFFPEPHESRRFGFGSSFVANNKYLAVGHTGLNKVIIYTLDDSGKWSRTREIFPPVDLALDIEGSIFGNALELDGDFLTISARIKNPVVYKDGLSSSSVSNYSYLRYLINLKTETDLKPIDLLVQKEPESNLVRFNLLRQGKIEQFILPDMSEEHFDYFHSVNSGYESNVALHQNLLLVGCSSYDQETGIAKGGALMFNLDRPQEEPLKLAIENTALGGTVAISQQFAAVGLNGFRWYFPQGNAYDNSHKTLIKNLNNGSTSVIDSFGELSLSNNVLVTMRPCNPEQELAGRLEIFRLDEDATPHFITERTDVVRAKVQNGFLITLKTYYYVELCIEPLP